MGYDEIQRYDQYLLSKHDIHMPYPPPVKIKNHFIGHKWETAQPKKKSSTKLHIFIPLCKFFGSKFKIMSTIEIRHFLKSGKLALNGPANGPAVTYTKIQNRLSRAP